MRIASFRMPSASSTLRPSQKSAISLLPPHFPLASRPNKQNAVDQFNLPSAFDLDADIIGVMAAGVAQCIADLEVHRLDRKRSGAVDGPVEPKLAVASGIRARPAGGVRDRNVGLRVDGIGRVLAPLSRCRQRDLQRRRWM